MQGEALWVLFPIVSKPAQPGKSPLATLSDLGQNARARSHMHAKIISTPLYIRLGQAHCGYHIRGILRQKPGK